MAKIQDKGRKLPTGIDFDSLFAMDGMSSLFDTDDRKNKFMDIFSRWFEGYSRGIKAENDAKNLTLAKETGRWRPGQYLSDRQYRELTDPESPGEKLDRLGFHGGMGSDGRFYTSYDQWKAHGGPEFRQSQGNKSFSIGVRPNPLRKGEKIPGFNGKMIEAQDWAKSDPVTGNRAGTPTDAGPSAPRPDDGTKRTVHRSPDGTITYAWTDSDGGNPALNRHWQKKADQVAKESHDLKKINEGLIAMGLTPIQAQDVMPKGRRAAVFGGRSYGGGSSPLTKVGDPPGYRSMDPGFFVGDRGYAAAQDRAYNRWALEHGYDDGARRMINIIPHKSDFNGLAMRDRGWLDAFFNGGVRRAALKGGKGRR